MPAMSTSVNSNGVEVGIADNMELDVAIFVLHVQCAGICYDECSLRNLWASFAMSWTAGNSLWSNFNVAL